MGVKVKAKAMAYIARYKEKRPPLTVEYRYIQQAREYRYTWARHRHSSRTGAEQQQQRHGTLMPIHAGTTRTGFAPRSTPSARTYWLLSLRRHTTPRLVIAQRAKKDPPAPMANRRMPSDVLLPPSHLIVPQRNSLRLT